MATLALVCFSAVATHGAVFRWHAGAVAPTGRLGPQLASMQFAGPDRVLADERGLPRDKTWDVTSGSLLVHKDLGWSGAPDAGPASGRYRGLTGSAVFRAVVHRPLFGDVEIRFRVRPVRLSHTARTPDRPWDGVTIFARYRSQYAVYALNIARRDGMVDIKRKLPEGPSNGGSYTTLAQRHLPFVWGRWTTASVVVHNVDAHTVQIALALDGTWVLSVVDHHAGALVKPGHIGLRVDNSEFYLARVDAFGWSP